MVSTIVNDLIVLFYPNRYSGPDRNGNEELLHISQRPRTETSASVCLVLYSGLSLGGGIIPL